LLASCSPSSRRSSRELLAIGEGYTRPAIRFTVDK
jgi:hypothetical protein